MYGVSIWKRIRKLMLNYKLGMNLQLFDKKNYQLSYQLKRIDKSLKRLYLWVQADREIY